MLPFYLHPDTRPSPTLTRDSPTAIRVRTRLVTLSVTVSTFITAAILNDRLHLPRAAILHSFGVWPTPFVETFFRPFILTTYLFAGPLILRGFIDDGWRRWITLRPLFETLLSWTGYRNFVVGPVSEEILFRALIISLHLHTPAHPKMTPGGTHYALTSTVNIEPSLTLLIFITPLYFGIAHIHHCYETRLSHPYHPFLPIFLQSVLQFAYTTLFGWYAAFIFLRTGNLWTVIAIHSFCNWMGLPKMWGRVGRDVGERLISDTSSEDDDEGYERQKMNAGSPSKPRRGKKRQVSVAPGPGEESDGWKWTAG